MLLFWPLKLCLSDFEGQSLPFSIISLAKYEGSMILRGKVWWLCDFAGQSMKATWFCGVKSTLRYNIAGQKLIFECILASKSLLFQRSIAPWWPLFRETILCGTENKGQQSYTIDCRTTTTECIQKNTKYIKVVAPII